MGASGSSQQSCVECKQERDLASVLLDSVSDLFYQNARKCMTTGGGNIKVISLLHVARRL